jgi:hypothetical protein
MKYCFPLACGVALLFLLILLLTDEDDFSPQMRVESLVEIHDTRAKDRADVSLIALQRAVRHGGSNEQCPYIDLGQFVDGQVIVDLGQVQSVLGSSSISEVKCHTGHVNDKRSLPVIFSTSNTFVGCIQLQAKETLQIRIQADTFDALTSLRIDDDGCHNPLESQELTCIKDPDTAVASFENLRDDSRQACFYVTAEYDGVRCRDTPEACVQKFQLGWNTFSSNSNCEMKVFAGFNAIHSVVASPQPYKRVTYPAECEALCLSKPGCDIAVWHEASVNVVWGNICVVLSREEMLDYGRLYKPSWVQQSEVITMVKDCQDGAST